MSTNIQIRSVDDELAAAAKAEATRRRMSLSDYLKELIEQDLGARSAARHRADLYAQVSLSVPATVRRADTAAAVKRARRELGLG